MLQRVISCFRSRWKLCSLLLVVVILGGGWFGITQWTEAQFRMAQEEMIQGNYAQARQHLGRYQAIWWKSAKAELLAARVERMDNQFKKAKAHIQKAKELLGGPSEETQFEEVLLRAQWGELSDVEEGLLYCLEKNHPEKEAILETLARAYMHEMSFAAALDYLNQWIELRPDLARAYDWRGWVYEKVNQRKKAVADHQKALDLNPDYHPARIHLVEALLELKRPDEAWPHLQILSTQRSTDPKVLLAMARYYILTTEYEKARKKLEAVIQHNPNSDEAMYHLARIELGLSRPEEAEKWVREALQLRSDSNDYLFLLSQALSQQGREEEAAKVLKRSDEMKQANLRLREMLRLQLESAPNDPEMPAEIGELFLLLNHPELGVHWLKEALRRDPSHVRSHRKLAEYYESIRASRDAAFHRQQIKQLTSQ